jgi:hypothetical protein
MWLIGAQMLEEYISHVGDVKVFLLDRLKGVAINSAFAFALCVVAVTAHALPIVAPLFTGASPEIETTGIAKLNERLEREFGNAYDGQVFNPLQVAQARDFVTGFNSTPEFNLVSIGFSIGAESVRALSSLLNSQNVALAILIDAFLPFGDELPGNVNKGINYFQIGGLRDVLRTGELGDFISGDDNVGPSDRVLNLNVEELFNNRRITHTSIDDFARLHERIVDDLDVLFSSSYDYARYRSQADQAWQVPEPSILALLGVGALGFFGVHWRRAFSETK